MCITWAINEFLEDCRNIGRSLGGADSCPVFRFPNDVGIGQWPAADVGKRIGKSSGVIAGFAVDVQLTRVNVDGCIYCKIDISVVDDGAVRDVEVVKPDADDLVANAVVVDQ